MAKKTTEIIKKMPTRPVGVTILSILGYIGAVFTLLMGLVMIFGSVALFNFLTTLPEFQMYELMGTIGATFFIIMGIILLPLAVLDYFIARGLWNGRNWARIIILVFIGISAVQNLFALPFSLFGLAIDGLIIWYLGFNKPVVAYFK
ncbi:MAG: hypothetical protein Q8L27_00075 [archaeon]|nr:hypothetical protein [archaeon]